MQAAIKQQLDAVGSQWKEDPASLDVALRSVRAQKQVQERSLGGSHVASLLNMVDHWAETRTAASIGPNVSNFIRKVVFESR